MTAIIDQTLGLKFKNLDLVTCVESIGQRKKNKESYESIGVPKVSSKPIYEVDPQ